MNNSRPAVLTFLRYYLPGEKSGGPVRTLANMVEALGEKVDFHIVTADRDVGDDAPYPQLAADGNWREVGRARVLYLPPSGRSVVDIARILRETTHDTLYLNSFFDPVFTAIPLLARRLGLAPITRCVIAPRGEFSPGALQLKAVKKSAYRTTVGLLGLYRDLIWQASSASEAADIGREVGSIATDILVAPNLSAPIVAVPPPHSPRSANQPLRVVFLSRISPMKNLDFALAVLRQVRVPIAFDIYGQLEDQSYWANCQELFATLPPHVAVRYCGVLQHRDVPATLVRYDLFFLPTRGENYGHAIVESLAVGTPVLISDATPWRNLADQGIGWDLPLADPAAFAIRLEQVSASSESETMRHRQLAAAFFRAQVAGGSARAANLSLFASLARRGEPMEQRPSNG